MEAKIKVTQRMLNKSIMDANKSVVAFAKEHLPVNYTDINNGERCVFKALLIDKDENITPSALRMYRRPRGDKLLSIMGLTTKAKAKAGDIVTFLPHSDDLGGFRYFLAIRVTHYE